MRPVRVACNPHSLLIMGVPKRFLKSKIEDFQVSSENEYMYRFVKDYLKNIEYNLDNGRGILFCGSNGVGKTMLSCIIIKQAYMHRYSCRRITFAEYIKEYTSSWDRKYEREELEQEVFEKYKSAELLVLEEIGKEIDSKIAKPILEDLLRYREEHGFTTIICTNMTQGELKEDYGNSILSIIKGSMTPIIIDDEDKRARVFRKGAKNVKNC